MLGSRAIVTDHEPISLKGISEPVPMYELIGLS
jgi:class 3 adenylate cyclase